MGVEPTQDCKQPLPGLKSGRPTGSDSLPLFQINHDVNCVPRRLLLAEQFRRRGAGLGVRFVRGFQEVARLGVRPQQPLDPGPQGRIAANVVAKGFRRGATVVEPGGAAVEVRLAAVDPNARARLAEVVKELTTVSQEMMAAKDDATKKCPCTSPRRERERRRLSRASSEISHST